LEERLLSSISSKFLGMVTSADDRSRHSSLDPTSPRAPGVGIRRFRA
jgi:hypothetical protein